MSPARGGGGAVEERLAVALHISCAATHLQYGGHCRLYTLVLYTVCTSPGAACIGGNILAMDANTATDDAAVAAATTVAIAVAVAVAREQRLDETLWTRRCLTHGQAQGSTCG